MQGEEEEDFEEEGEEEEEEGVEKIGDGCALFFRRMGVANILTFSSSIFML